MNAVKNAIVMFIKSFIAIVVVGALLSSSSYSQSNPSPLDQLKANPGKVISFNLPVKSTSGDSTIIPVTVIHGQEGGPVLGLISGVHGSEYPPIIALQRLKKGLDPSQLKGTVIIVQIANVEAFLNRNVYVNPVDGKNLNRSFPGNPKGTLTECIAWTLSSKIFPKCDFILDVHAGDANEDLHPYVGYYEWGEQAVIARKMAEALNFPWLIISNNTPKPGQPTLYSTSEAISQGIPAVAIEYGKRGQVTLEEADFIADAIKNMMRVLEMLPGEIKKGKNPLRITDRAFVTSDHSGIFYSSLKSGDRVKKGAKLGVITDFFGNDLQEVVSPVEGIIVYMVASPPIKKGETLFSLAVGFK
jgi:predicted deacylase